MKKLSSALASMVLLVTAPALAAESAPAREAVSITVSTDGLDLSSARDQARLRDRVSRAIASVCDGKDVYASDLAPDRRCYREMAHNAEAQLIALNVAPSGYSNN